MVINPGKSHYIICLGKNVNDNEVLNFNGFAIKSSEEVEILAIKMSEYESVNRICVE